MTAISTQDGKYSEETKLMKGRVALVTGASRGIGAATAKLLAYHGATVGVNYYNNYEAAQSIVEEIEVSDGKAIAVQADVTDEAQVQKMVQRISEAFGQIDTLVLSANKTFTIAPFINYQWSDFEEKLVGELQGVFYPCKAIVPSMIEDKRGCIIAISSGLSRYPSEGFIAHSTAKSGLDAFIKNLALELGPLGIRVNAIAPGLTLTEATMFLPEEYRENTAQATPLRRNAMPEDIAGAILMLASNEAKFVTGVYLPVSGGIQML
ncbi:SDR family oxidoreductase [Nostoc sp. XA010]|uniref:SDR family oxidoreductase n=1 Tax=Nostoc sp. XA010 TaxID=2780407 RepID=UPI001E494D6E|nr:SDR family oxidoreductase [Nostoc sp. XA010]MCC5661254.1 SDR family oxidoreductase [Nostoc sp. XA010]